MHGERFNIGTHLFGLGLAVAGAAVCLLQPPGADILQTLGVVTFCLTAIALYACSAMCHGAHERSRKLWERMDHATIFLLIAGTFTPFALAAPRHLENLVVLGVVWAVGLFAFWRSLRTSTPPGVLSYLAIGLSAAMAAAPVALRAAPSTVICLVIGVMAYSVGTLFYLNHFRMRHAHGIWHLFVVGGTASHFIAVIGLAR